MPALSPSSVNSHSLSFFSRKNHQLQPLTWRRLVHGNIDYSCVLNFNTRSFEILQSRMQVIRVQFLGYNSGPFGASHLSSPWNSQKAPISKISRGWSIFSSGHALWYSGCASTRIAVLDKVAKHQWDAKKEREDTRGRYQAKGSYTSYSLQRCANCTLYLISLGIMISLEHPMSSGI